MFYFNCGVNAKKTLSSIRKAEASCKTLINYLNALLCHQLLAFYVSFKDKLDEIKVWKKNEREIRTYQHKLYDLRQV
jgi:Tfp pilus assembly protein PilO